MLRNHVVFHHKGVTESCITPCVQCSFLASPYRCAATMTHTLKMLLVAICLVSLRPVLATFGETGLTKAQRGEYVTHAEKGGWWLRVPQGDLFCLFRLCQFMCWCRRDCGLCSLILNALRQLVIKTLSL